MITLDGIVSISALVAALAAISGAVAAAVRWFDNQAKQDKEISKIKRENMLIVAALSACLDGLTQLGANHSVTVAKRELDEYLNEQAHGQSERKIK